MSRRFFVLEEITCEFTGGKSGRIMPPMDNTREEPGDNEPEYCRNCGAPLSGDYCGACGQRVRELRLSDVAGEAIEDLADLDSRLWITLKGLVFKPGSVTADYINGRRARYVPPIRLYLVVSFLVFLTLSMTEGGPVVDAASNVDPALLEERGRGLFIPRTNEEGKHEILTVQEYLKAEGLEDDIAKMPTWFQALVERMVTNAERLQGDPRAFTEGLTRRLPQMMFFLLPVFALLLWLFYLGAPHHYLQHLIFSVHYHTVAFLLFLLMWPVNMVMPGDYGGIVTLVLLIHLPLALRQAYPGGNGVAVLKGLAIGLIYYFIVIFTGTLVALGTLAFL
jgi:hypothetical protein